MNSTLRQIAVYVDEPTEQDFRWVLQERGEDGQWTRLAGDDSGSTTYKEAMANGLLRLQSLVANLDTGPRLSESAKEGPTSGKRKTVASNALAAEGASQAKRAVFGFGLAN